MKIVNKTFQKSPIVNYTQNTWMKNTISMETGFLPHSFRRWFTLESSVFTLVSYAISSVWVSIVIVRWCVAILREWECWCGRVSIVAERWWLLFGYWSKIYRRNRLDRIWLSLKGEYFHKFLQKLIFVFFSFRYVQLEVFNSWAMKSVSIYECILLEIFVSLGTFVI